MKRIRKNGLRLLGTLVLLSLATVLCAVGMRSFYRSAFPQKYTAYVTHYAEEYEVDPAFLYAIIKTESDFQPHVVSQDDACGLMQLLPSTLEWLQRLTPEKDAYTRADLFEPEINIRYGTYFIAMLFKKFEEPDVVAAAYHAGINGVAKWLQNPAYSQDGVHLTDIPYADTAQYVERVMQRYQIYQQLYKSVS